MESVNHCSFCSKHKDTVGKLIVGHDVAICNECVQLCDGLLKNKKNTSTRSEIKVPNPRDIRDYLNQYVVGQDSAKIVLSVAIANHYKRINNPDNFVEKSNILMLGPTGVGKTLLAKTVAKYLNVPFVIADATTLTEAGYVGEDADSLITRLYQHADCDVARAERGIVFLDEVDKISRKSESSTVTRDVSGEGVQQALLKLIEGTTIKISPSGSRKSDQYVEIDTTNILFIAGGAFINLDKIVKTRVQGTSMGFAAQLKNGDDMVNETVISEDLVKYGMIPEFVGRFSNVVSLQSLTKLQLISILKDVKHNFIEQYRWLFSQDGVDLEFEEESLELIAEKTLESKTGARGLHTELERILLPHMFDLHTYRKQSILKIAISPKLVNTPITLAQENG
jgi:ATP-dependent Clp protease ATP-binding subunit ClpX